MKMNLTELMRNFLEWDGFWFMFKAPNKQDCDATLSEEHDVYDAKCI